MRKALVFQVIPRLFPILLQYYSICVQTDLDVFNRVYSGDIWSARGSQAKTHSEHSPCVFFLLHYVICHAAEDFYGFCEVAFVKIKLSVMRFCRMRTADSHERSLAAVFLHAI